MISNPYSNYPAKELRFSREAPYDVIVCGAGHAGCEAALAAARRGASTLMLTGNLDTVAAMSCNPAIGGQAKGQIVGEVDALGGAMGVNADSTAIQFRQLNTSKGPAVRARRAQCDKKAYQFRMKHTLERQQGLTLFQAMVAGLEMENGRVVGVRTSMEITFYAHTVVVTTGTFLRGLMHIGSKKNEGGRLGDFSANTLSQSFLDGGIELQRLKTGTPPRILGSTIDTSVCEEQHGDEAPSLFAFYDTRDAGEDLFHVEHSGERCQGWEPGSVSVSCWCTRTSDATRELVNRNLHRSPLYGGEIESVGPRYCPSIEDKFVKFADKPSHRLYLEPEGLHTNEWYINGLSTSLPFDIQQELLRSIPGLENVCMLRPAYAVEYDFAPPTQLYPSLESRKVEGLFFAGQINGTSGYEEAAGQGLIAGVNASAKVFGESPLILGRHEAYLGVLIDDLVTKGTREPYRMFTSRAEHRLLLNHDSAELRLVEHAQKYGLVSDSRLKAMQSKKEHVEEWVHHLENHTTKGGFWGDVMRQNPDLQQDQFPSGFQALHSTVRDEILYRILYKGYREREERHARRMQKMDHIALPGDLNYFELSGLRRESAEKLDEHRPVTLGQASRISGVNPADINVLYVLLSGKQKK